MLEFSKYKNEKVMKMVYLEHLTPFMLDTNHCQSHGWRLRSGLVGYTTFKKKTLLDDYHAWHVTPCYWGFSKIETLRYWVQIIATLTPGSPRKYPNHEFSLIMGKDNLTSLSKWKILKLFCKIMRSISTHRSQRSNNFQSESSDLKSPKNFNWRDSRNFFHFY
jgi:hypothetical protein